MDMQRTPVYQILYVLQLPTPVVLTIMYMPFVSLFAAFALFGRALLQILAHKLSRIGQLQSEEQRYQMLIACIQLHITIARY